jgi:hypothetical protein
MEIKLSRWKYLIKDIGNSASLDGKDTITW